MKRLHIYDFDSTLYQTPDYLTGKDIWLEKTGTEWLARGWWSKSETLDTTIFDIPLNQWVHEQYLLSKEDNECYTALVTGRIKPLKEAVLKVLEKDGIKFDEVHCNWGGPTLNFKLKVFSQLVDKHKNTLEEVIIYDDRDEHIGSFIDWSLRKQKELGIIVNVIHVK